MVEFVQQKHFLCCASSCFVVALLKMSMFVSVTVWQQWWLFTRDEIEEHGFVVVREVMGTPFRCGVFSFGGKKKLEQLHFFHIRSNHCGYVDCWERRNERCSQWFQTKGRDVFHSHLERVELGAGSADATGLVPDDLYSKSNALLLSGNVSASWSSLKPRLKAAVSLYWWSLKIWRHTQ